MMHRIWIGLVLFVFAVVSTQALSAQETSRAQEIWEYSPYRVRVWLSISPTLSLSDATHREIHRKVAEYAEIHFGPTWNIDVQQTPDALFGSVLYHLEGLTVDQILSREMVLLISKSKEANRAFLEANPPPPGAASATKAAKPHSEKAKDDDVIVDLEAKAASLTSVKTLHAAIERVPNFVVNPLQLRAMQRDIVPHLKDESWNKLNQKLQSFAGSSNDLEESLKSGKTIAAFVTKNEITKYRDVARVIPTRFPWQPEAMLRERDKVFLVSVDREGEKLRIQAKELDTFVRKMGQMESIDVVNSEDMPRAIAYLTRQAFTSMARIEENDPKTAIFRVRASGLVTTPDHPTSIVPGDVLSPYIRRDDLNGNPTLLQSISFTYLVATESIDTSRYFAAIFSASRGALAATKNRRTQRVALKITPRYDHTDLKLNIRQMPGSVVPGAEIYLRTPGDEDMQMVGRTDWRGMLAINQHEPPTILYELPSNSKNQAISKAKESALKDAAPPKENSSESTPQTSAMNSPLGSPNAASLAGVQPQSSSEVPSARLISTQEPAAESKAQETASPGASEKSAEQRGAVSAEPSTADVAAASGDTPPPPPKASLKINVPLYLYYVKNGETLLARLPIITGYQETEAASLPDDRRRLQAEAFLKGLQGEMLDIVARRKILETRIKQKLEANKLDEAEKLLDELKRVKSYDVMMAQIHEVQRRAVSTDDGPVSPGALSRIEKMIDATREMMQKYLQDSIVRDLEVELARKK